MNYEIIGEIIGWILALSSLGYFTYAMWKISRIEKSFK